MKETQHLEYDLTFTEVLPSAAAALKAPRWVSHPPRPRGRLLGPNPD